MRRYVYKSQISHFLLPVKDAIICPKKNNGQIRIDTARGPLMKNQFQYAVA